VNIIDTSTMVLLRVLYAWLKVHTLVLLLTTLMEACRFRIYRLYI